MIGSLAYFATDVAEQPLDGRVHVFVGLEIRVRVLCDLRKARLGLVELLLAQEPRRRKTPRVLRRRLAVVRQQLSIVDTQEADIRVEAALDPPRPRGHTWILARSRAACNSVSSEEMRMKPSAASCGNVSPVPYEASSVA